MHIKIALSIAIITILTLVSQSSLLAQSLPLPTPPPQSTLDNLKKMGDENLKKYGDGTTSTSITTTPKLTLTPTPSPSEVPVASPSSPSPEPSIEPGQKTNYFVSIWNSLKSFFQNLKSRLFPLREAATDVATTPNPSEQPLTDTGSETVTLQSSLPSPTPTTTKAPATPPPATIAWSSRPLSWNDFVGKPDHSDPELAKIAVRISAQSELGESCTDNQCVVTITGFQIKALMNTQLSYVVPGAETPERLSHEQTHFDLTEAYARKLRRALTSYIGKSESASGHNADEAFEIAASRLDQLINPIVMQHQDELHQEQLRYDRETNHSLNRSAQAQWDAKVNSMLNL